MVGLGVGRVSWVEGRAVFGLSWMDEESVFRKLRSGVANDAKFPDL